MSRPDSRRDRGLFGYCDAEVRARWRAPRLDVRRGETLPQRFGENVTQWLQTIRIDPDNRYIAAGLEKLDLIHTRELKELSALSGFYALLFAVEGTGLLFGKRWRNG